MDRARTIVVIIYTHLSSCLRTVNIDLLLGLAVERLDRHDTIVALSLALA